jgi:ribonuclease HII
MVEKFDRSLLPGEPDLSFETALWEAGIQFIAGIDEAGRGSLAGPVAAAAVVFPSRPEVAGALSGVRDSKQMTSLQREAGARRIRQAALAWGVGFASVEEIESLGILPATRRAVERAVEALSILPDHLLLDCLFLPEAPLPQTSLVKGDCRSMSIAAASVLAKTGRDALMRACEAQYPGYGFTVHKGYGTAAHRAAIDRLGPCALHRRNFRLGERHPKGVGHPNHSR